MDWSERNVLCCGDYLETASIDGAIASGIKVAQRAEQFARGSLQME
jgi:predicted NAD/FAD-dependent oxidoreductase